MSHRDYCPRNVVFRDGLPAALIDVDLAGPTTRVLDAVGPMVWWVPLRPPQDRASSLVDADVPVRVRAFRGRLRHDGRAACAGVPTAVQRARVDAALR